MLPELSNKKNSYSLRDLSIISISNEQSLVIACDSIGGIGPKTGDVVQVDGYVVGRFLARVPLLELIAFGATPISLVNTLAVEWEPSGKAIYEGIIAECKLAGYGDDISINGSTEENIATTQTGVGITAIGLIANKELPRKQLEYGDELIVVGLPKVGEEIFLEDDEIVKVSTVKRLASDCMVKEIIPVGSKGINHEINELLTCHQSTRAATISFDEKAVVDRSKSGGPATCIILVGVPGTAEHLQNNCVEPVVRIGYIT